MSKQISLVTTGFELVTKRTRKRVFLGEMDLVVPWTELVGLIKPFALGGTGAKGGRPPFAVETMLRIDFLQQWLGLSDPAMEEALQTRRCTTSLRASTRVVRACPMRAPF